MVYSSQHKAPAVDVRGRREVDALSNEYIMQLMVNLTVSLQLIVSGLFFLHPLKKRPD